MDRVPFSSLPEKLRKRLLELRAQGSTLKGLDGEREAAEFFDRKRPKPLRTWENMRYYLMVRIDSARKKLGLEPIHFT